MSAWNPSRPAPPQSVGLDPAGIAALTKALEDHPAVEPHALVVARHGQVVARRGWEPYSPDQNGLVYSLSKSFTVTALGVAVLDGLVGLDDLAVKYFPEVDDQRLADRLRRLSLANLASMATGHATGLWEMLIATPPERLFEEFWQSRPEAEPGTLFAYNQMATYCLAEIVHRVSGQRLLDFLRARVFAHLGIDAPDWQQLAPGLDLGFTGLFVSADAIAALGQLYLDGGVWNGRRLLPAEFVAAAGRPQVATDTWSSEDDPDWRQGYGYQFWISRHGFRGDGAFGQYCLILPEQDMVVALTSETSSMQAVLDLIWATLLPAVEAPTGRRPDPAFPSAAPSSPPATAGATAPPGGEPGGESGGESGAQPGGIGGSMSFRSTGVEGRRPPGGDPELVAPFYPAEVTAELGPERGEVRLVDPTAEIALAVRRGEWVTTPRGPASPIAAAARANWTGDEARVDVQFVETPHRLTLTLSRDGACLAGWATQPLLGQGLRDLGHRG